MEKYQIQTKLFHVEDVLVAWGPIQLTLRQCFVLILGGCGSLDLWGVLGGLTGIGTIGLVIRIALTSFPTLLAIGVAAVQIADRYAEAWVCVFLRYAMHPSVWLPQGVEISSKRRKTRLRRNTRRADDDLSTSHKKG